MTVLQQGTATVQRVAPSGRSDEAGAVAEPVEAGGGGPRRSDGTTVRVLQLWIDRMAGLPFTLLAGGDTGALLSGRAWVDGSFDVAQSLVAAQRQYVDQFLAVQHQLVGQFLDSSSALATAAWDTARRSSPQDAAGR
jgi:hypothetical protein